MAKPTSTTEILRTVTKVTDHHTKEAENYAFDGMKTKAALHNRAIIIFVQKGSRAYVEHCVNFRLSYSVTAKNINYNPALHKEDGNNSF